MRFFSSDVTLRQLKSVLAERPIRCFEVLAEIKSSWSTGKTVNSLLLKRTALSSHLSVEVCERVLRRCDANVDI